MMTRGRTLLISAMIWACIFMMDTVVHASPNQEVASFEPDTAVVCQTLTWD